MATAAKKKQTAAPAFTSVTCTFPKLKAGEKFVSAVINPDGSGYRTILMPGDKAFPNWDAAKAWAEKQGGTLPDRVEHLLLLKFLCAEFKPEWSRRLADLAARAETKSNHRAQGAQPRSK